ncbi:DNA/RNA non-specific endonuclease [Agreia pratensis]|uniref:DNA/RNA non-specific endonuclease n=1 Tax=Agreia pratensis TaxID=150121 RepID=UPI0015945F88|nr:DNA/RNA non-specific endonuclease [Agreia pratensis]
MNKPQPNVTYDVTASSGSHHVFVTDDLVRTVSAQVDDLTLGDAPRSGWIQSQIARLGGLRFEGGHLVSNATAGGRESINIIAMLRDVNRGSGESFGNLESMLREAIRGREGVPPAHVSFEIYPHYPAGGGKVPDFVEVQYSINDGRIIKKAFPNV